MTVRCPAFLSYKYLIIYADTAIDRAIKGMSACTPSAPLHRRTHASTGTDTSCRRFLMSNKFTGKRHAVNRHSTTRTTGHTPPETGTAYVVHLKKHHPTAHKSHSVRAPRPKRRTEKHVPPRHKANITPQERLFGSAEEPVPHHRKASSAERYV